MTLVLVYHFLSWVDRSRSCLLNAEAKIGSGKIEIIVMVGEEYDRIARKDI
jgi:hypothetical protein